MIPLPFHTYRQSFFQSQLSHSEFLAPARCSNAKGIPQENISQKHLNSSPSPPSLCLYLSLSISEHLSLSMSISVSWGPLQCAHLSNAPSHPDTQAESASSDVSLEHTVARHPGASATPTARPTTDFCVFQSLLLKTLQTSRDETF